VLVQQERNIAPRDPQIAPEATFADLVLVPVAGSAQGHGVLVRRLQTHAAIGADADMCRIAGEPAAAHTRQGADPGEVGFAAVQFKKAQGEESNLPGIGHMAPT